MLLLVHPRLPMEETLPFFNSVQKEQRTKDESLTDQVRRFMKDTDGGAVPPWFAQCCLGISRQRVSQLVEDGTLRAFKVNGRVLISTTDIDAFDEKRKKQAGYQGLLRRRKKQDT